MYDLYYNITGMKIKVIQTTIIIYYDSINIVILLKVGIGSFKIHHNCIKYLACFKQFLLNLIILNG